MATEGELHEIINQWSGGAVNSIEGTPEKFMIENSQGRVPTLFDVNNPQANLGESNQVVFDCLMRLKARCSPDPVRGQ